MVGFLIAALLPSLHWNQGPESAAALKQAGISRLRVATGQVDSWKKAGFDAEALPLEAVKTPAPGVRYQASVASATRVPWVDANGWRFLRKSSGAYFYDKLPKGTATLAAAEAYAYGVDAALHAETSDLDAFGQMLAFLKRIDRPSLPAKANIGIIDDGTAVAGEVMNLLARRNLLFQLIFAPDARYTLTIRMGSKEYPKELAANPFEFATAVREKLTDQKRLLRLYGSEVVLGHLTGDGGHARLHLINYGSRPVNGLRVRVLGSYGQGTLSAFRAVGAQLLDYSSREGATEFTVPEISVYAVVDLER